MSLDETIRDPTGTPPSGEIRLFPNGTSGIDGAPATALGPPNGASEAILNGSNGLRNGSRPAKNGSRPGRLSTNGTHSSGIGAILWMRRVGRAWQSIHERLALDPLPLTTLVPTAGKRASHPNTEDGIQVVSLSDNGSAPEYGILAPPYSRLAFNIRLGKRPRFAAEIKILDRNAQPPGVTEFLVDVEANGSVHRMAQRSVKTHGPERRRRLTVDLGRFSGQDVTIVLRTRVPAENGGTGVPTLWGNPRVISSRPYPERIAKFRGELRRLGMRRTAETFVAAMKGQLVLNNGQALYQLWIEKNELKRADIVRIEKEIASFSYRPLVSIATPVYNTDPRWLRRCIESVRNQIYPNWELCLADDASTEPHVRQMLRDFAARDHRIRMVHLESNAGISGASNAALEMTSGTFIGLLDHDDELARDALFEVVALLQNHPDADVIYTDEDKIEPDGTRTQPFFKPDWSPEYLLSCMYTCHFTVYRKTLLDGVGGFRRGFEGSQDYDLMLRVTGETDRIFHIPRVLYHWRRADGSAADSRTAKPYAYDAGKRALQDHLERRSDDASLLDGKLFGFYRVRRPVSVHTRVSIVILTKNNVDLLRTCIDSIESKTSHTSYEILVVDNNSTDPRAEEYYSLLPHPVIRSTDPFNYSRLNNLGASRTTGDYLVFLNNDTEVITPDWLTAMLEFCQNPDIGAVGAKLLFPDGRIQHAGITLGLGGVAGHFLTGFPADSPYYFGIGNVIRNCSAVTGACMMTRRDVFESVGGFDENLPTVYNDVDYCLRVRNQGLRIVWTPFAELYHHESASRGPEISSEAIRLMKARWGKALLNDPYYNPNLTLEHGDCRIRL